MVELAHLLIDLPLPLRVLLGEEAARHGGLHLAELWLGQVLGALTLQHGLLLVEEGANLVDQSWALAALERLLGPRGLTHLPLTVHIAMVRAICVPNLVNEILLLERLVEIHLLSRILEVEPVFERGVPFVVGRDLVIGAIGIAILAELLEHVLTVRYKRVLAGSEVGVLDLVHVVLLFDVAVNFRLPRIDLIHDPDAKLGGSTIRYVIETVKVNQLRVAELRHRGAVRRHLVLFLLHLLQLRHFDEDLMDFIL